MVRFGTIGDAHLRPTKPVGRTDSFIEDITDKLKFVRDELLKRKITTLIVPGDLLDIKTQSKYNIKDIQVIIQQLEVFGNSGIEVVCIPGNHDLPNSSRDKLKESVYWFLCKHGYFKDISEEPYENITGICYTESEDIVQEIADVKTSMCILHEHCFPDRITNILPYIVRYFTYSKLVEINPNVKVWILGHLHTGFPTEEFKERIFINPYSLTRMDRGYVKADHKPQLVIYDNGRVEDIYIPIKPAADCFIEKESEFIANIDLTLDSFIDKTTSLSSDDNSIAQYMDKKLQSNELRNEVIERIHRYLGS